MTNMITKEQLNEIDFVSIDGTEYFDVPIWDAMFNIKTQTLFSHNEVNGETEEICKVTDIEKLKELYDLLFNR